MKRLGMALGCLFLAACTRASGSYYVLQPPQRPFSEFGTCKVLEVRVDFPEDPERWFEKAQKAALKTQEWLREEIDDEDLFAGEGPMLRIEPRILEYEADYEPARLWGGGGGMLKGSVVLDVRFVDPEGGTVARIQAVGTSEPRGWFVASLDAAHVTAVDAVVEFVRQCFAPPGSEVR